MTGRDPVTGKFTKGNQIAKGNKGNRKPKWGNKNAVKHGFFATALYSRPFIDRDGWLYIRQANIRIHSDAYYIENDSIFVRNDILELLKEKGLN